MDPPAVIARGLGFAEGPVAMGHDRIVVVSVDRGHVYEVATASGDIRLLADTGGGPNAAAAAVGDGIVVTQNGGFDFRLVPMVRDPEPPRRTDPGIQAVHPDGRVTWLARGAYQSPNDLVVHDDGSLWFTDPPRLPATDGAVGRVWRMSPDGDVASSSAAGDLAVELVASGFGFCNGIAVDVDGSVLVVERRGVVRVQADGTVEPVVEDLGTGGADGLCIDVRGRIYAAATTEHAVRVIEDGRVVERLEIPGPGLTTNCCFGGSDGRTLFVADGIPGALLAWEGLPDPGRPLPAWAGSTEP